MTLGDSEYGADRDVPARPGGADPERIGPLLPAPLSALDQLGERIAELAAQISAATYELLVLLRDFDQRGGWNGGFRSCAHWLGWRVGLDLGAAREKLRRALVHRDGGCRFPGCGLQLCDAHHVEHWADGGETSLANTLLLCRRHHRAVHEEGFSMELAANGEARFYRPDGRPLPEAPALPGVEGEPVVTLVSRLASQGIAVDGKETLPSWWGGPCDYAWEIEWLRSRDRQAPAAAAV